MKRMKNPLSFCKWLFCLGLLLLAFSSPAQAPPKEEAEFKRILTEFTQAYADFPRTKDKSSVLRHMAPELATELTNYLLNDEIGGGYSDLAGFNTYLDRLAAQPDLSIDYKITKFLYFYLKEGLGVGVYEVSYAIKKGGEAVLIGNEVNTVNLIKKAEGWKIAFYSVYDVPTELNRGTCLCELFQSSAGNFMAKTTFPAGKQYETKLDNFSFALGKANERLVKTGKFLFRWLPEGKLLYDEADGTNPPKELGTAQTNAQVVFLVLRHVLYAKNCLEIKRK
jgi:hypothetical protein